MAEHTRIVPMRLGSSTLLVAATVDDPETLVKFDVGDFDGVLHSLRELVVSVGEVIAEARPKTTTVELGVQIGMESGQLTALLAKGAGQANLKISMTWER